MNYTKPEITSLASASSVIQSGPQKMLGVIDSKQQTHLETVGAYEADE